MTKVLVIYASDEGNTKAMAEAVAEGAAGVEGVESSVCTAGDVTGEAMSAADAVLFGSPTHMGSMHWEMKKFIDDVCSRLWYGDAMSGKIGAVFATGGGLGSAGGGVEVNLLSMLANLAEMGMIIVPLPKHSPEYGSGGVHWGPWARTRDEAHNVVGVGEAQRTLARAHGANVARVAKAMGGAADFAR